MQENNETQTTQEAPQQVDLQTISKLQAGMLAQVLDAHIMSLTQVMIATNGVSYAKKLQAEKALREAIRFAMDFGVEATGATIRGKGTAFANEVNNVAGVMVKAIENNMVLRAYKLQEGEVSEAVAEDQVNVPVEENAETTT